MYANGYYYGNLHAPNEGQRLKGSATVGIGVDGRPARQPTCHKECASTANRLATAGARKKSGSVQGRRSRKCGEGKNGEAEGARAYRR
jgi:hypothetical protein